jgi:YaiO family outer membrane protein
VKPRRRPASLLAAALLFLAAAPARAATPEDTHAAKLVGDYPRAIALYEQLAAQEPANPAHLLGLGTVQGWAGRYADALRTLERGLALEPRDTDLRLVYGRVLAWSGKLGQAEAIFLALAAEQPRNLEALNLLGRAQLWQRRFDAAEKTFAGILALAPTDPDALIGSGDVQRLQERHAEARAFYERARQANPGSAEIRRRLAGIRQAGHWRLDAGAERSTFSGDSPRADWEGWDAALRYALDKKTGLAFSAQWARRFGLTDEQYSLGFDRRFGDAGSGYARASATPAADFFARRMLDLGGEWRARVGNEKLPPTVLLLDYRAAGYAPGTAHSLWLGVAQSTTRRVAVTAKYLFSRNLNHRWTRGWQARLDGEPSERWRWSLGYADSKESLSSTVFDFTRELRTRAVFGGFYREFSPAFGLRLDLAHEWSPGGPARNALHAGFVTRF